MCCLSDSNERDSWLHQMNQWNGASSSDIAGMLEECKQKYCQLQFCWQGKWWTRMVWWQEWYQLYRASCWIRWEPLWWFKVEMPWVKLQMPASGAFLWRTTQTVSQMAFWGWKFWSSTCTKRNGHHSLWMVYHMHNWCCKRGMGKSYKVYGEEVYRRCWWEGNWLGHNKQGHGEQ